MTPGPRPTRGARAVRGWCPGVVDPMQTGDGWLVRIRLPGGTVTAADLRTVAAAASRYGSGQVDVTSRGNLQVRGVAATGLEPAAEMLTAAGLSLADAALDARRAVVTSPLAGHDPAALVDPGWVVAGIVSQSVDDAAATGRPPLPAKFGVVVDDGGAWPLAGVDGDVRLVAAREGGWWVGLRGSVGPVGHTTEPVEAAVRVARLCAEWGGRIDATVGSIGIARVVEALGIAPATDRTAAERRLDRFAVARPPVRSLGVRAHPDRRRRNVIVAPFLGRLDAATLVSLGDLADASGAEIRVTTDRSLALCAVAADDTARLVAVLAGLGLVVRADDPRALVSACVGSRGCAAGHADTWLAASHLAAAGGADGSRVHLSACAKGCGSPPAVRHLVADPSGTFS